MTEQAHTLNSLVRCPICGSADVLANGHPLFPYRCVPCWKPFEAVPAAPADATLFTKLQVAERFIESAREHFADPENTRCAGCTQALIEYDVLNARPLEEIRAELRKSQQ